MTTKGSHKTLARDKKKPSQFFVAIVGRSEPKTGGEFYNQHALTALADELGDPLMVEVSDLPAWIRFLYPRLKLPFYLCGNIQFSLRLIQKRPRWCYIDYYMYPFAWLPTFIVHLFGGKTVVVVHDLYHAALRSRARKKIQIIVQSLFLRGCDLLIATSKDTSHRLLMELGVRRDRIRVIYPGVEPDEYKSDTGDKPRSESKINILFVGMVNEEKRVLDLVKAAIRLTAEGVRLVLHVAGSTDVEPEYAEDVRREAVRGGVELIFHGFLSRHDLNILYFTSHIFVIPSVYETYGMVVAEAMKFGLPVVATRVGGIPELITHGENGLLYTPGDLDGLTENLRRLCLSPSLRENLGGQAQRKAATFSSWDDLRRQFLSIVKCRRLP